MYILFWKDSSLKILFHRAPFNLRSSVSSADKKSHSSCRCTHSETRVFRAAPIAIFGGRVFHDIVNPDHAVEEPELECHREKPTAEGEPEGFRDESDYRAGNRYERQGA